MAGGHTLRDPGRDEHVEELRDAVARDRRLDRRGALGEGGLGVTAVDRELVCGPALPERGSVRRRLPVRDGVLRCRRAQCRDQPGEIGVPRRHGLLGRDDGQFAVHHVRPVDEPGHPARERVDVREQAPGRPVRAGCEREVRVPAHGVGERGAFAEEGGDLGVEVVTEFGAGSTVRGGLHAAHETASSGHPPIPAGCAGPSGIRLRG